MKNFSFISLENIEEFEEHIDDILLYGFPSILKGNISVGSEDYEIEADLYMRLFFFSGSAIYHVQLVSGETLEDSSLKINGIEVDLSQFAP